MSFMEMYIYDKAPTYTADCDTCGATIWAHPDTGVSVAELRSGHAECPQCASGHANPDTVTFAGTLYAGRYSANGYMDCTDWHYGSNLRELKKELRDIYGED